MRISIDNKGKKESFSMIDSWNDVTVEKYARLVKYQELSGASRSLNTIGLFTDIPKMLIKQLDVVSLGGMLNIINKLQEDNTQVYTHKFKHEGVSYGMIPDLSAITLGEYADLETFIGRDLIDNLSDIAAVLFRPITEDTDNGYTIESYDLSSAKIRSKLFKTMSINQVQSALVFFWSLGNALLIASGLCSETLLEKLREKK